MKLRILIPAWLCLAVAACVPIVTAQNDKPADPAQKAEGEQPADAKPGDKPPPGAEVELATQAREILRQHCYECHGQKQETYALNVKQHATVVDGNTLYVVPGKLADSGIWQVLAVSKKMPPADKPRPTIGEISIIKEWIEKGAVEWPLVVPPRPPFISDIDVLAAMRDDLRKADAPDRPYFRYFSLLNLHNNWTDKRIGAGDPVEPETLVLARAALSKACNSLSFENAIAVPEVIPVKGLAEKDSVLLRIDLRKYGWDKANQWNEMLKEYPYGLKYTLHRDQGVRQIAEEVAELAGTELPCVRIDWFIDTATRPKLYAKFLQLPDNVQLVEKFLGVDVIGDFEKDRLARAGFSESGVSRSNRLVDRHPARFGSYWKSYDFAKSEGRGNLFQFPLGPDYKGSQFSRQAFEHDGGEMIFNLPNGLQAYYLSDASGKALPNGEGPIAVVRDLQETGGSPVVLNGLSCMACHANGMKRFEDTIRNGLAVQGNALLKVDRLYPTPDKMNALLDEDEERFLNAVGKAMARFLNPDDPKSVNPKNYKEPVGFIARNYQRDLTIEEATFELGMDSPEKLKILIESNARLRQFGLGALVQGKAIKRQAWSSRTGFNSVMQKVASELDLATPHNEL